MTRALRYLFDGYLALATKQFLKNIVFGSFLLNHGYVRIKKLFEFQTLLWRALIEAGNANTAQLPLFIAVDSPIFEDRILGQVQHPYNAAIRIRLVQQVFKKFNG